MGRSAAFLRHLATCSVQLAVAPLQVVWLDNISAPVKMTRTTEIWRHWERTAETPGVPLIALSTGNVTSDSTLLEPIPVFT